MELRVFVLCRSAMKRCSECCLMSASHGVDCVAQILIPLRDVVCQQFYFKGLEILRDIEEIFTTNVQ